MKHSKDETVIHLNEKWAFEGDSLAVTLYEKRVSEKGNLNFFARGFYQNISDMFHRLIDHEVNSAMVGSLKNIEKAITDIKYDIFLCIDQLSRKNFDELECLLQPHIKEPKEIEKESAA